MIRYIELFAGIGCQATAFENLKKSCGYESEPAAVCEIDDKAYQAYKALHGDVPNLGDITKVEKLPQCDLLFYSFPCQDLSIAGSQKGMQEGSGTRSALLWEVGRLLKAYAQDELPKYLIMENVPSVTFKKNIDNFNKWIKTLSDLGYTSEYKIMNAKDYGIPQNRKRCFMVSMLDSKHFIFPQPVPLELRLKDMLEDDVDESYFLSKEKIKNYEDHMKRNAEQGRGFGWNPCDPEGIENSILTHPSKSGTNTVIVGSLNKGYDSSDRVYGTDGVAPTITTPSGGGHIPRIKYPTGTKRGYMEAKPGDGLVMNRVETARGTVQDQSSPTLTCGNGCGTGVVDEDLRIRYLTERECLRLMGFDDDRIDKLYGCLNKTNRYKVAGNGIVVQVLEAIFKNIFEDKYYAIEL